MIVTCPRCLTKFSLPDENLSPGIEVNLHCSRCQEEFRFSPQGDSSVIEDAIYPLPDTGEGLADNPDLTEIDQSESVIADTADLSPDIEFDEDFEAVAESDMVDSTPLETVAEDEFDVNELFSSADAASGAGPEVSGAGLDPAVDEDTIFELSDDFDSDGVDFDVVDDPAAGDIAEPDDKDSAETDDSSIEELALDIDDIEFDSLEDEPVTASADTSDGQSAKPTQIDDDDDFAGLLDPGADAEIAVTEPAKSLKSDKNVVEKKPKFETEIKPVSGTNQKRTLIMVLACFLVLSLALWAGYGLWQRFSVNMTKHLQLQEISNQRLRLPSDRVVIVLRGKLVNSSPKLVTDIKIKGVLLDKAGKVVAEVVTSGGVSFSEMELDLLDSKKLSMLENSAVNLPPNGGELPFMVAFYDYPASASECFVEVSSFKVKKGRLR